MVTGRKHDMATVEARRVEVETAMLSTDWTLAIQAKMAQRHDVSPSQIRQDAAHIRKMWAAMEAEGTDGPAALEERAEFMRRLRRAQQDAKKDANHSAVARLMRLEGDLRGIAAPVKVEVTHQVAQQMTPAQQAQAIVESYDAARRYLSEVNPAAIGIIDMEE